MKSLYLMVSTFFLSIMCIAQNIPLKGKVINKQTNTAVEFASVTNIRIRTTVIAGSSGNFTIPVSLGDLLLVGSIGFHTDTVRITEEILQQQQFTVAINQLVQKLQDVTVNTAYSAYQRDSLQRRQQYFGNLSSKKLPTFSNANSGAGIGISLDKFYKKERKRSKWIDLFTTMEMEQYINYRFSPEIVKKYTGLQGEELLQFIEKNRPTYQWLRNHKTEEDILYYINDLLKKTDK